MIAARVRNNSLLALFDRERGDLVVGPAQFERSDWLLAFQLEIELAISIGAEVNELGSYCNPAQSFPGFVDVVECDYGSGPPKNDSIMPRMTMLPAS